jgi:hypothetical protein
MKTYQFCKVLFLAVFVVFSTTLLAENSFQITGSVVKSENPALNHANVILVDSQTKQIVAQTTCNENGEFTIQNVPNGNYTLYVQKPGFKKAETRHIIITENGTVIDNTDLVFKVSEKNLLVSEIN